MAVRIGWPSRDRLAYFAQSIALEDGPSPEESVAGYGEVLPVRESALDAVLAAMAGEFSRNAWLPNTPFLPRLRTLQRQQLGVVLPWVARRQGLPRPDWIGAIAS